MDWFVWRLVASKHLSDGLWEIRRRWSFWDHIEAHMALDALEEIEARARRDADPDRGR